MEEYKYPIKYAVIPVGKVTDSRNIDGSLFIATKCYVTSERTNYRKDGTSQDFYEVKYLSTTESFVDPNMIEAILVDELFNDYEEASIAANLKNQAKMNRAIGIFPLTPDIQKRINKLREYYQIKFDKCSIIEKTIEELNSSFAISENYCRKRID